MKGLTLKKIAEVTGGEFRLSYLNNEGKYICLTPGMVPDADGKVCACFERVMSMEVSSIVTDSRKAEEGSLFGAIVGARADGHDYIGKVFAQGAMCVLCERELKEEDLFEVSGGPADSGKDKVQVRPWIMVKNTLAALGDIAAAYLQILGTPVVGITGSVGKTSTKEMIASVLSVKLRTLKTDGNFNNELGLPLTVFRLTPEDEVAVLEMGVSHFGDMTTLARIARPDRMVITNIGTCHLEFLKDREGVFQAKTEVFDYVKPGGQVLLNGNDDLLRNVSDVHGIRPVFFGVDSRLEGAADLSAGPLIDYPGDLPADQCVTITSIRLLGFEGSECVIRTPAGEFKAKVPVPGIHNCSNAAAAAAVGLGFGMTLEEIRKGIESAETISGRFRILKSGERTVIDDCYNANPVSMKSSLAVLSQAQGRRVAVLGDMGELGENELALHESVGTFAASAVDHLVAVGPLSRSMYEAALKAAGENAGSGAKAAGESAGSGAEAAGESAGSGTEAASGMSAVWYETVEEFLADKDDQIRPDDTVLVKASHYMAFGRIVEALT